MGFLDRIRNLGAPARPEDADRLLVRQLQGMGASLARPRHVLHFLYFDDEASARAAAEAVEQAGYGVSITPPVDAVPQWSVRAEAERVVDTTTVAAFRGYFERVAASFGGEYDGWEASAKP